jgi:hypothetical protein
MASVKQNREIRPGGTKAISGRWVFLLMVVLLALLFWRSFSPDYVHFSNDGPLGQQNAAWSRMPGGLTGMWGELNYLGADAGTGTLNVTTLFLTLLSPVAFAKFYAPLTLLLLGLGAWTFFRQLKLSALAAALGALATMLNSTYFSTACWGVASQEIAVALVFFALALVVANTPETPAPVRWARLALAGLCVGMNVMEAADIGALLSLLVALFVFVWTLNEAGAPMKNAVRGVGRVAVVASFAVFIAAQAVLALVGTQIQGVAGTGQDTESKAAHWDWATQWSLPKTETLGLAVPGLFGYKMDTPKNMMPFLQDAYQNGNYWGGVGRAPELDRYFDGGSVGPQPSSPNDYMRFTGGGNYCGILVLLVAAWALAQSCRRKDSAYAPRQQRVLWFLAAVMILCLLCAWGRFAPLYALLYKLPYFSTIRNPAKFIYFFGWALVTIFAYGVDGLGRRYFSTVSVNGKEVGLRQQLKDWWRQGSWFDRGWLAASAGLIIVSVAAWNEYVVMKPAMIAYLQKVGFTDIDPTHAGSAPALLAFSYGEVAWSVVLLVIAVVLVLLVVSGCFRGSRAKWGAILLVSFVIFDLGRANLPWVAHWDYKQKYEVGSLNPILNLLRDKPYEHRVTELPFQVPPQLQIFHELYAIEWMQHQFPFYDIQSLDIVQMPRMPEDMLAYETALAPRGDQASLPLIARKWQLTSTRYLLGVAPFIDDMNQSLDPVQHRFRFVQRFDVVPKPGVPIPAGLDGYTPKQLAAAGYFQSEQLTAVATNNGDYALFEFTGALPRAKVFANWQVNTNDAANLKLLGDLNFDPLKTVLVSTPENGLPAAGTKAEDGSVEYQSYRSKHLVLTAKTTAPSVLLLNDKYDPHWRVTVDGQPAGLLRCNYLMRGVYLPTPGTHTVVFDFSLPHRPLYVTAAAMVLAFGLCGYLLFARKRGPVPVPAV